RGTDGNASVASRWYKKASDQGHADAHVALATQYLNGTGVNKYKNPRGAVELLKKAADQNHPGAQWTLGLLYETATGVNKSVRRAKEYFGLAAAQRHVRAQHDLAVVLHSEKRFDMARAWLCEAGKSSSRWGKSAKEKLLELGKSRSYCDSNAARFTALIGPIVTPKSDVICLEKPTTNQVIADATDPPTVETTDNTEPRVTRITPTEDKPVATTPINQQPSVTVDRTEQPSVTADRTEQPSGATTTVRSVNRSV
ncbi:uncharacterized protein METZ01_LOCUS455094, partial [marine metagenome]